MLCVCFASAWAADLTPAQEKAQLRLYSYLDKQKFEPEVDVSDNSVCFRKGGVLYWITFSEESPILYTFNRKAYKIGNENNTYKRNPATIAANEVNRRHKGVKLTVGDKKVDIAIQAYAAQPEDFIAVFNRYFAMFDGIDEDFKREYANALKVETENANRIEDEMRKNLPPSVLRDAIQSVSFRLVNGEGEEVTPYDKPMRSYNAHFIQTKIIFKPWNEKTEDFTLQLRVIRPDGRPLYLPGEKFTAEMPVSIEKSKKPQEIEFDMFGTDVDGFWKAGEYKLEVLESGDVIYTTSFNIL